MLVAGLLEKAGVDAIEISGGLLNRPDLLDRRRSGEAREAF